MKKLIAIMLISMFLMLFCNKAKAEDTTLISVQVNAIPNTNAIGYRPDVDYSLEKFISTGAVLYNKGYTKCVIIMKVFNAQKWHIDLSMTLAGLHTITDTESNIIELEFPGYQAAMLAFNTPPALPEFK